LRRYGDIDRPRSRSLALAVNGLLLLHSSHVAIQAGGLIVLTIAAAIAAGSAGNFRKLDSQGWFSGHETNVRRFALIAAVVGILDTLAILA
jgi:hypothetical protein